MESPRDIDIDGTDTSVYWEPTGIERIDFAPADIRDDILDKILNGKHGDPGAGGRMRQFQTYITGKVTDDKVYRVRVNAKYKATNSEVGVPPQLEDYKKTTIAKRLDDSSWDIIEDRVGARDRCDIDVTQYIACLIFLQEPRYWVRDSDDSVTSVAFKAVTEFQAKDLLNLAGTKVVTMNKK